MFDHERDEHDILAERLNAEPVIFKGCGSSELAYLLVVAVAFWFPVSIVLATLLGAPAMGIGSSAVGVLATVWFMAGVLQRLKRGRPDGYYQQRIVVWLHDHKLRRSPLIRASGAWDIGRTLR